MPSDILNRNNVTVIGDGSKPMMFAGGFGCDQHMWRYVVPAFLDDFKIVLFDYVGSERSDLSAYDPARYDSLDGYARDVLDICAALDLKDLVFVGHSIGGVIGMLATIVAPEIFDRLALIAPSARFQNDPPDYRGGFEPHAIDAELRMMDADYVHWAEVTARAVMLNPLRPELAAELATSLQATDPVIARRFVELVLRSDIRSHLPRVTTPCVVMQSSKDRVAPASAGMYLYNNLQNSAYRRLDASGHCPHLSAPAEVIGVLKEYLASA